MNLYYLPPCSIRAIRRCAICPKTIVSTRTYKIKRGIRKIKNNQPSANYFALGLKLRK